MFRVLIEANGQIAYQRDVSTKAYALYEARELAIEAVDGLKVDDSGDLARYQTNNGFIRAVAL
jgi:hypothetical protein